MESTSLISPEPIAGTSALASFDCRLIEASVVATHRVLIGEVVAVRTNPRAASLVYLDRAYRHL